LPYDKAREIVGTVKLDEKGSIIQKIEAEEENVQQNVIEDIQERE